MARHGVIRRLLALLASALVLCACSNEIVRPDLKRLYAASMRGADQPPVVVVHGVLGAKLRDRVSGVEAFPGGLRKLAFSEYRDLALPIDPDRLMPATDTLEPYAIFDSAGGNDFYGEILRTIEHAGGYALGKAGEPPGAQRKRYYVYLYDWRRDNIDAVRGLDALIEQIRADYADPTLEVDLIAHSNGGLISRYFVRYGTVDLLDGNDFPVTGAGARKVRRLILLGTPNFGSVGAVKGMIEGTRLAFRSIPPEVLMTFPTAYQLFPHALNTWLIDLHGNELNRDLFDVALWRRFEWAIFDPAVRARIRAQYDDPRQAEAELALRERYFGRQLERARRFSWSLSVSTENRRGVKPIVLGGDCELTPARLLIEDIGDDSVLRLWPKEIENPVAGIDYDALMLEPGDGTVTKASLLAREALDPTVPRHKYSFFPLDYAFFICERHDRLTGNATFQDNLLHALLCVDR